MDLTDEQLQALDSVVLSFKLGDAQRQADAIQVQKQTELDEGVAALKVSIDAKYQPDIDASVSVISDLNSQLTVVRSSVLKPTPVQTMPPTGN